MKRFLSNYIPRIKPLGLKAQENKTNVRVTICFIADSGGWGGTEKHTFALIKFLITRGYCVEYISCRGNNILFEYKQIESKNLKIIHSNLSIFDKEKKSAYRWLKQFKQLRSRILIFQRNYCFHGTLIFLKACRKYFDRVYFIEHAHPLPMAPKTSKRYFGGLIKGMGLWWLMERARRKAPAKFADQIVAVSASVRHGLIKECGYPPDKTIIIRNGIDWRQFYSKSTTRRQIRQKLNVPLEAKVFAVLGRLSIEKGFEMAIEAFQILLNKNRRENMYLFIIGEGPEEKKLKALAARNGSRNNIRFVGFVDRPQSILPMMDFILAPSRQEGLSLALLEGMAAGCLPIIFRVGGMPEVVSDFQLGWVVEPNDIAGFSRAMEKAMNLSAIAFMEKRRKVMNHIKNNFNAKKSHQRILETFHL